MSRSKSIAVARRMLERANAVNAGVTPMQLIKLVYIAHGYMLGHYGRPLLNEQVEAWQYGPVVRSVYDAVKGFQSLPVTHVPHFGFMGNGRLDPEEEAVIDEVAKMYGGSDAIVLSAATHKRGTPWDVTWSSSGRNAAISNDLIEHFYRTEVVGQQHSSL